MRSLLVAALVGAASAFNAPELQEATPITAFGSLPGATVMPVGGSAITGIGGWDSMTSKGPSNPPANLAPGWPYKGKGGTDNLPLPYSLSYAHTLHGYAGFPMSAGADSMAFAKKDLEKPGMAPSGTDKLPVQTKATAPALQAGLINAVPVPVGGPGMAPYGLPKPIPMGTPAMPATPATTPSMVMPQLKSVPAPLTTLPTAAPMALPQMGFAFPHGAMFGV